MKKVAALTLAVLLGACQNPDITAYHHAAAHPYKVTEASERLRIDHLQDEARYAAVRSFAAQRPNEGSSFVVSAPMDIAMEVRAILINAGVDGRDIRLVPEGVGEVVRTDRYARVDGCNPPVTRKATSWLPAVDDGWRHDNSNSQMLGCAVRRNVVEMVDDPRTLVGPVKNEGRDGARAATAHKIWTQGKNPSSQIDLKGGSTTDSVLSGDGK